MVDVKIDPKGLDELLRNPRVAIVDSYIDGGYAWDVYEVDSTVDLHHRGGEFVDVILTFSVNRDIDGSVYVRDVNHILNSDVHIDDQDDICAALQNYNKNLTSDLVSGSL